MIIFKNVLILTLFSVINFLGNFIFNWLVIVNIGPSTDTDAFISSNVVPQFFISFIGASLSFILVPIFSNLKGDEFYNAAWNFLYFIFLFVCISVLILYLSIDIWVPILFPGFDSNAIHLTIILSKIQLLSLLFNLCVIVLISINMSVEKFYYIETVILVSNILSISVLNFVIKENGIIGVCWVSFFKIFVQFLLLILTIKKVRRINIKSNLYKQAFLSLKPLLIGSSIYKTDIIFEKYLLSMSSNGIMTILNLAQQVIGVFISVLNRSIVLPIIPKLSRENNFFFKNIKKIIYFLLIIVSFIFIFWFYFGKEIIKLLPGIQKFTHHDQDLLFSFIILLFGFLGGSLIGNLTSNAFYAKKDTKTPSVIGIITFLIFIPLKFIFFYAFGVNGLILSNSVFVILNAFLQFIILKKQYSF